MTFLDAIALLNTAVIRTDLEPLLPSFLNQAVKEVAVRHSFDEMKATTTIVMAPGEVAAKLPDDFKEFQNGRFPILDAVGTAFPIRVPVYARSELERFPPAFRPTLHFLYTQDNRTFQIILPAPASVTNTLTVYYFAFPPLVTDMNETSPLLENFENLVMAKARSLAFQSINDPVAELHEKTFEMELALATGKDIEVSTPAPRREKE